jgi:hypothetical protein
MSDPGAQARAHLIRWLLTLLNRPERPWTGDQLAFIDSLLKDEEGAKTLAELAVARVRIRSTRLGPRPVSPLDTFASALDAFWEDPSLAAYEMLRAAGRTLKTKT